MRDSAARMAIGLCVATMRALNAAAAAGHVGIDCRAVCCMLDLVARRGFMGNGGSPLKTRFLSFMIRFMFIIYEDEASSQTSPPSEVPITLADLPGAAAQCAH